MKPSNFIETPMGSVLQKSEAETVALNIMKILKRTGDKWRILTDKEYISERKKDGNYSDLELHYFTHVLSYTIDEESVRSFSPVWKNIGN